MKPNVLEEPVHGSSVLLNLALGYTLEVETYNHYWFDWRGAIDDGLFSSEEAEPWLRCEQKVVLNWRLPKEAKKS